MAHFVRDTVGHGSDLSAIMAAYGEERAIRPFRAGGGRLAVTVEGILVGGVKG